MCEEAPRPFWKYDVSISNMAVILEAWMSEEKRAVISFLDNDGEKPVDIHRRMKR